jgi:hypothetical protein
LLPTCQRCSLLPACQRRSLLPTCQRRGLLPPCQRYGLRHGTSPVGSGLPAGHFSRANLYGCCTSTGLWDSGSPDVGGRVYTDPFIPSQRTVCRAGFVLLGPLLYSRGLAVFRMWV